MLYRVERIEKLIWMMWMLEGKRLCMRQKKRSAGDKTGWIMNYSSTENMASGGLCLFASVVVCMVTFNFID